MTRLANISGRRAARMFCNFGYEVARRTGSHIILRHPTRLPLVIPDHREVAPGLLRAQIARAGLTVEEFLAKR